ncbi:RNA polymerase sigma factor [Olivibacter sp. XZL3]|uniref:RNA polymerase sigma factor n=1 Tax=Olivibacter sp. XZL3 TaxID=1735116 RepID=UPI001065405C|nr:sigma-70 family RNA polymerase sigma factor [Olivibacter sp. XZL3]
MLQKGHISDEKLVQLLKTGNKLAFTIIYDRYWKSLLSIAYNHLKDPVKAEELVQDIFLDLWARREHSAIDNLRSYLAGAIKFSVFKTIYREKRRKELLDNHEQQVEHVFNEQRIDLRIIQDTLEGLVNELPKQCKLVFKKSRYEYKPNKVIANELNISEKSVEANLTRALKSLRYSLERAGILSLLSFMLSNIFGK